MSTPADLAIKGMLQDLPGTITTATAAPINPPAPPEPPAEVATNDGENREIERGDIALATRFVNDHLNQVFFCPAWDRWHLWDGMRWKADDEGAVFRLAEKTMRDYALELFSEADRARDEAQKLSREANDVYSNPEASAEAKAEADKKSARGSALRKSAMPLRRLAEQVQALKKMRDMIELAKTRKELVVRGDALDAEPYLLNTNAGVVDLRDGRIYKHDPKRRITRLCPVDLDLKTPPGRLQEIFDNLFQKDVDLTNFAQEVLGNSMMGNNRLEKFYIWYGPGGGGKGALMEGIKAAVGDYAMTAEYKTFIAVQGARVRDDLARLAEARFVLSSEVKKGETWDTAVLKSITGNDTIAARQLYGSYFEFRPRLTLHLQCNDLPRADDQDSGLPCGPQIPEDKQDPTLKEYLLDPERGGRAILAWLVNGAIRTHSARRLTEPAAVKSVTYQYRQDQDPLKEYFGQRLRFALPDADHFQKTRVTNIDIMKDYQLWAGEMGIDRRFRCAGNTLKHHLEAMGCEKTKVRVNATTTAHAWVGVTLQNAEHTLGSNTFMPLEEEHEQAMQKVPKFHCSSTLSKSSRARAPSISHVDLYLNKGNNGTLELNKTEPPSGQTPPAIDLGSV
jgi:putative DNA primase/helicase